VVAVGKESKKGVLSLLWLGACWLLLGLLLFAVVAATPGVVRQEKVLVAYGY
jgi:hypothetical protein